MLCNSHREVFSYAIAIFFSFQPSPLDLGRYLVTYVHQTIVSYCISRTMNSVSRAKILTIPPFEKFKRSAKLIMTELKEIHTCVQSITFTKT